MFVELLTLSSLFKNSPVLLKYFRFLIQIVKLSLTNLINYQCQQMTTLLLLFSYKRTCIGIIIHRRLLFVMHPAKGNI